METPKEAPKSLMQVQSIPESTEFEKDFVDVDEDAEEDESTKSKSTAKYEKPNTEPANFSQLSSQEK